MKHFIPLLIWGVMGLITLTLADFFPDYAWGWGWIGASIASLINQAYDSFARKPDHPTKEES